MGKSKKKVKEVKIAFLRKQYEDFIEEDRKRKERNGYILSKLEKIKHNDMVLQLSDDNFRNYQINRRLPFPDEQRQSPSAFRPYAREMIPYETRMPTPRPCDQSLIDEKHLLREIGKKYILIPKFTTNQRDFPLSARTIEIEKHDSQESEWERKYQILKDLKKLENDQSEISLSRHVSFDLECDGDSISTVKPKENNPKDLHKSLRSDYLNKNDFCDQETISNIDKIATGLRLSDINHQKYSSVDDTGISENMTHYTLNKQELRSENDKFYSLQRQVSDMGPGLTQTKDITWEKTNSELPDEISSNITNNPEKNNGIHLKHNISSQEHDHLDEIYEQRILDDQHSNIDQNEGTPSQELSKLNDQQQYLKKSINVPGNGPAFGIVKKNQEGKNHSFKQQPHQNLQHHELVAAQHSKMSQNLEVSDTLNADKDIPHTTAVTVMPENLIKRDTSYGNRILSTIDASRQSESKASHLLEPDQRIQINETGSSHINDISSDRRNMPLHEISVNSPEDKISKEDLENEQQFNEIPQTFQQENYDDTIIQAEELKNPLASNIDSNIKVTTEYQDNVHQPNGNSEQYATNGDSPQTVRQFQTNDEHFQHITNQSPQSSDQYPENVEQYQHDAEHNQQAPDQYQNDAAQYQQNAEYQQKGEFYQHGGEQYEQDAEPYQQDVEQYQQETESYQQDEEQYQQNQQQYHQNPEEYQQNVEQYQQNLEHQQQSEEYQQITGEQYLQNAGQYPEEQGDYLQSEEYAVNIESNVEITDNYQQNIQQYQDHLQQENEGQHQEYTEYQINPDSNSQNIKQDQYKPQDYEKKVDQTEFDQDQVEYDQNAEALSYDTNYAKDANNSDTNLQEYIDPQSDQPQNQELRPEQTLPEQSESVEPKVTTRVSTREKAQTEQQPPKTQLIKKQLGKQSSQDNAGGREIMKKSVKVTRDPKSKNPVRK